MEFGLVSNDPQIANQLIPPRNFKVNYVAKTDALNKKEYSETNIKFLTSDVFTLKYLRNNDLYAYKSDEVISKYLAVENNNLKNLAEKLQIENADKIPNKIQGLSIEDLLYISKNDMDIILQKYTQIINQKISKDKYTKKKDIQITVGGKDILTNVYTLELTNEDFINVIKEIIQNLKNDETTLNIIQDKLKMIIGQEKITIEDIKGYLQKKYEDLDKQIILQNTSVKLSVYEKEGELIRTEFVNSDSSKIIIDYTRTSNAKRILISFEHNYSNETNRTQEGQVNNNDEYQTILEENTPQQEERQMQNNLEELKKVKIRSIEIAKQKINNQSEQIYIFTLEKENEIIKITIQDKLDDQIDNGQVIKNTGINFNINDTTYFTVKIATNIVLVDDIQIEDLTNQNSAKLNEYEAGYLQTLIKKIQERLNTLYEEKIKVINMTQQQANMQEATQQTQIDNTQTNL